MPLPTGISTSQHLQKFNMYFGLLVQDELNDLQSAVEAAIDRVQVQLFGFGVVDAPTAIASSPADLNINVGVGSALLNTGKWVSWGAQVTDVSAATIGTNQGNTAVLTAGKIRYVIIGVEHATIQSDSRTDDNGAIVNFAQDSGFLFNVGMTAELTAGTDWRGNANVDAVIAQMRAAGSEPLVIAERVFAVTAISNAQIFTAVQNLLWEAGDQSAELSS